ncbi:MAG: carboxypeptidase-like regulatory domain-containing protein [Bryobacteraceae bacterium]
MAVWMFAGGGLVALHGQTTQGLVNGKIRDALSEAAEAAPAGCEVTITPVATESPFTVRPDDKGAFALPLLSPGTYRLRAECPEYQAQQIEELRLPVAGTLDLTLRLRRLADVFEGQLRMTTLSSGAILPFYGPDVDLRRTAPLRLDSGATGALESAVSHVVQPEEIQWLPLAGRDVYALLVMLPGITTETSTSRGLGLSTNGQRPTSSNYLLDGVENTNFLIGGPATALQPEAVQEYKATSSGFAAEYGRTSGSLANAVTVAGGSAWHGFGYLFFRDDGLNAAEFQRNRLGLSRRPMAEVQPGFGAGGPLPRRGLFFSATVDHLRFRSEGEKAEFKLPTSNFKPKPGTYAEMLWNTYPNRPAFDTSAPTVTVKYAPPAALDRWFLTPRLDWATPGNQWRLFTRAAVAMLKRPDFIWTPYRDFSSPLTQDSINLATGILRTSGRSTTDLRIAFAKQELAFDRAHPEVPVMVTDAADGATLPGSPASYGFRHAMRHLELIVNRIYVGKGHTVKFGGTFLPRAFDGYLTLGKDGYYSFRTLTDFGEDRPERLRVSLSRLDLTEGRYAPAQFDRGYRAPSGSLFAQDSMQLGERFRLNGGLRYEYMGTPRITGPVNDVFLQMPQGGDWDANFRNARLVASNPGQRLYESPQSLFAPRIGFTARLTRSGQTLLRAAWGLYYDRFIDNLSQNIRNNGFQLATQFTTLPTTAPIYDVLPKLRAGSLQPDLVFSSLGLFSDHAEAPVSSSYFAGVDHQFSAVVDAQFYLMGAEGSNLLATDLINRQGSIRRDNRWVRFRPDLPTVSYRTTETRSSYRAVTASLRIRSTGVSIRASYTFAVNRDHQSEPLTGDFFDLGGVRAGAGGTTQVPAAFSYQFEPEADWGYSDYDQRHNFAFSAVYDVPPLGGPAAHLFRNWRAAVLFGARSGFPFPVLGGGSFQPGPILNQRPDLIREDASLSPGKPAHGGVQIVDPASFQNAQPGLQGSTPRNAFASPGYYNFDLSISRAIPLSERWGRMTLRIDAFNVLNHANLGTPVANFGQENFGTALFGRTGRASPFPALTPYTENPRQLQLSVRLDF